MNYAETTAAPMSRLDGALDCYRQFGNPLHLDAALSAAAELQRELVLERIAVERRAASGAIPYAIVELPRRPRRKARYSATIKTNHVIEEKK